MTSLTREFLSVFMVIVLAISPIQDVVAFQINGCDMQSMTLEKHQSNKSYSTSEEDKHKNCAHDDCCCNSDQCNCINISHAFLAEFTQSIKSYKTASLSPLVHVEHIISHSILPWLRPPISWNRQVIYSTD